MTVRNLKTSLNSKALLKCFLGYLGFMMHTYHIRPAALEALSSWLSVSSEISQFLRKVVETNIGKQGRRVGVKGVIVSRGPGLKKGPRYHKSKRKIGKNLKCFHFGLSICRLLLPCNSRALGRPIQPIHK